MTTALLRNKEILPSLALQVLDSFYIFNIVSSDPKTLFFFFKKKKKTSPFLSNFNNLLLESAKIWMT